MNFEDAPDHETAELVGTLTVRIQRVDGLKKVGSDLRPYARMTAFGANSSSNLKLSTLAVKTGDDTDNAIWDPELNAEAKAEVKDRNEMKLHVTAYHTHLDFEVIDGFQVGFSLFFCDFQ